MLTQRFLQLNLLGAEWVNWVLVILSIIGLAITVDRLILYWRTRERFAALQAALQDALRRQDLAAARALVQCDSLVRNVLRAGLDAVGRGERDPKAVEEEMLATLAAERSRYDARVAWLTTIANIAPAGRAPRHHHRRGRRLLRPRPGRNHPVGGEPPGDVLHRRGARFHRLRHLRRRSRAWWPTTSSRPTWASGSARPSRSCARCSPTWAGSSRRTRSEHRRLRHRPGRRAGHRRQHHARRRRDARPAHRLPRHLVAHRLEEHPGGGPARRHRLRDRGRAARARGGRLRGALRERPAGPRGRHPARGGRGPQAARPRPEAHPASSRPTSRPLTGDSPRWWTACGRRA